MKLLVIHNNYQSKHIGGEDIVFRHELLSLKKELGEENVFSYEVSNDDIKIFKLILSIWFSLNHYKKIKSIIINNSIDIVHIHNFFPLLTPAVFKASRDAGAKVVHTLHNYRLWCISGILYREGYGICESCVKNKLPLSGIYNKCYRNSFFQSFIAQSAFWFYRLTGIFNNIDYYFALTNFQSDKLKSFGIEESKIIIKPNSFETKTAFISDKNGYIFVGRLERSKGIFELLDIWENLDEKYILKIVGTGEILDDLRKKYNRTNIIFMGKCSREDTLKAISESRYLVQSSLLYETFGLVIIEAFASGVPVIGFDIGTRGDFIENEVNGFLCDVNSLEETIKKSFYFKNYDLLSKNALLSSSFFNSDVVIKNQIKIYKDILEK